MEKSKIKKSFENKKLIIGVLIGVGIAGTLTYAGNQGLIGSAFECLAGSNCSQLILNINAIGTGTISDIKLSSGITASKISGNLANATISSSKISGKIDVSSLTGTLDISQLPDGVGGDAKTLSGKTVSEILDNSVDKIPTNKAVMDKISGLLNCNADEDVDGYSVPFTSVSQSTSVITKTGVLMLGNVGTYTKKQQFKCNGGNFEKVGNEIYTDFSCIQDYYISNGAVSGGTTVPVCSPVGNGYYSVAGNNTKTSCTEIANMSKWTSDGNGSNNCDFSCNAGYYKIGRNCYISCSAVSVGQSCQPSWGGGVSYMKYNDTSIIYDGKKYGSYIYSNINNQATNSYTCSNSSTGIPANRSSNGWNKVLSLACPSGGCWLGCGITQYYAYIKGF